jgi:hypothetical protein
MLADKAAERRPTLGAKSFRPQTHWPGDHQRHGGVHAARGGSRPGQRAFLKRSPLRPAAELKTARARSAALQPGLLRLTQRCFGHRFHRDPVTASP